MQHFLQKSRCCLPEPLAWQKNEIDFKQRLLRNSCISPRELRRRSYRINDKINKRISGYIWDGLTSARGLPGLVINFDRLKLAGCTQDRRWDFRVRGQLVNLRRRSPFLRSISTCTSALIAILSLRSYNYDLRLCIEISYRDDCITFHSWGQGIVLVFIRFADLLFADFPKGRILIFHALFTGIAIRKAERKRREMGRQEKTLNREHGELKPVDNAAR